MDPENAYNRWASIYDSNRNRTRDAEAVVLRETLNDFSFASCLEIGCGTGKNTAWLAKKATNIIAVDLSENMLAKAKEKVAEEKVTFIQADVNKNWDFITQSFDLVSFSLVLEHIEHLEPIFEQAVNVLQPGGFIYIAELHPFKQYSGTKANFETTDGKTTVECYIHHISDYTNLAKKHQLSIMDIREFFDADDRNNLPRIFSLLLKK